MITRRVVMILVACALTACSRPVPEIDVDRAYADLLALVEIGEHRRSGTPNELKTVELLEARLRAAGLEPVRDSFETEIFVHEDPWIEVGAGASAWRPRCFPLYYTGSTGPEGRTAPAVLMGRATADDVEAFDLVGKIAVVELRGFDYRDVPIAMPDNLQGYEDQTMPVPIGVEELYDRVAKSGAVGLIAVVSFGFRNAHYGMNTFEFEGRMRMPGLMVSAEDGERLVRELGEDPGLRIAFQLDARLERRPIHNISVVIPGQREDAVVLNSAHTAWFKGAVERAGSAGVVEIARIVNQLPLEQRLNTFVLSLATGHEIGWLGVERFMETETEVVDRMAAFVNMGSSIAPNGWVKKDGEWRATGEVYPRFAFLDPFPRVWEIVEGAVRDNGLKRVALIDATHIERDSEERFAAALGIPTVSLICSPPYYHSSEDLPEHMELENFRQVLEAYLQIVTDLLMADRETLREHSDGV
jgi:hypothetical protein